MATSIPPLYAICDAGACAAAGWTLSDFAAACIDGGATLLQVRAKSWAGGPMLETIVRVLERARPAAARVIVNDRADVARLALADGVHVGQEDLPPAAVRAVVGPGMLVGLSTHTVEQVENACAEPVGYVAVGPVFGTSTKSTGYSPVGLAFVRDAAGRCAKAGLPVVAIGGITLENAPAVLDAGAASVAVIGDLLTDGRPADRVRRFLDSLAGRARWAGDKER